MPSASKRDDATYLELIKQFRLKPIRSERENDRAARVCDNLVARFDKLSRAEKDYLEVLSELIQHFESQWQEDGDVEPRALLQFLMEQNQLSQTDLIPELGSSSRVSEFLSGKRELSLPQIIKLSARFKLSPSAFICARKSEYFLLSAREQLELLIGLDVSALFVLQIEGIGYRVLVA